MSQPLRPAEIDQAFPPPVAIYGTGHLGRMMARLLLLAGWPVVAVYNRAGPKVGQELESLLGAVSGKGLVVEDIATAEPGRSGAAIALIAGPDSLDACFPIYERFLSAGINVLSFGSGAYDPHLANPELAAKLDALARQHGATFCGGGLWDVTRIWSGLLALGPSLRVDAIEYKTDTEVLRQGPHWAQPFGIDMSVDEFDDKLGREVSAMNQVSLLPARMLLKHLDAPITQTRMPQEPVVMNEPVYCPQLDRQIAAGRSLGTRLVAEMETERGITVRYQGDFRVLLPEEVEHGSWHIRGVPNLQIRVVREDPAFANLASLINRVPDVLRASPGIVPITELGPLQSSGLFEHGPSSAELRKLIAGA